MRPVGGSDLPSYYERRGGLVISAAIDKYVYITVHRAFEPELILKYSKIGRVRTTAEADRIRISLPLRNLGSILRGPG